MKIKEAVMRRFWLLMAPFILIASYWNLAQGVQAFGFSALLRVALVMCSERNKHRLSSGD